MELLSIQRAVIRMINTQHSHTPPNASHKHTVNLQMMSSG